MELEHVLPEIRRPVDSDRLLAMCRQFADVLTNKRWISAKTLGTAITRDFHDVVTRPAMDGLARDERTAMVQVRFSAEKEEVGYDEEWQRPEFDEVFTIGAKLREQVTADELPDWIIEQVQKGVRLVDAEDTDDETAAVALEDLPPEAMENFTFHKVFEVVYVVDGNQDINISDYAVSCSYLCDGNMIDAITYSWADTMVDRALAPTSEEVPREYRADTPIGEDDIRALEESFDDVIEIINQIEGYDIFEEEHGEEGVYTTVDEHCRRALAMIALNSRRFIGMRIK